MIPNEPIWSATSLSSIEAKPKYELSLTSLRHFAHRWIAVFVNEISIGISTRDKIPKRSIASIVNRYPSSDGRYSTIELDTASQKGHFIFVDLNKSLSNECKSLTSLHRYWDHLALLDEWKYVQLVISRSQGSQVLLQVLSKRSPLLLVVSQFIHFESHFHHQNLCLSQLWHPLFFISFYFSIIIVIKIHWGFGVLGFWGFGV